MCRCFTFHTKSYKTGGNVNRSGLSKKNKKRFIKIKNSTLSASFRSLVSVDLWMPGVHVQSLLYLPFPGPCPLTLSISLKVDQLTGCATDWLITCSVGAYLSYWPMWMASSYSALLTLTARHILSTYSSFHVLHLTKHAKFEVKRQQALCLVHVPQA